MAGIVRRLDNAGRIVLPKEIRKKQHIEIGEPMEMYIGEDMIELRKYKLSKCAICGGYDDVIDFFNDCICLKCVRDIKKRRGNIYDR